MKSFARTHLVGAALFTSLYGLSGCSTTQVLSTWKDPAVGQIAFHKVLVLAPGRDASIRHTAEDELAKQFKNVEAVPSYTLIPDSDLGNQEAIRARAQAAGFDGAVVMRVVNVNKQASWVPGAWSGPYYAFGGWPSYDPGYVQVDTYVRAETNVYSLPTDKLIWASATETTDPSSVRSLVKDTAKAVANEMRNQGLIP